MSTSGPDLPKAVYKRLSNDTALANLGAKVYDEVPETAGEPTRTPYVVLDDFDDDTADAHDRHGIDTDVTIEAWSRYRGYDEVARILRAIDDALHRKPLTVTGFHDISVARVSSRYTRDSDPELRRGVAIYRVSMTRTDSITS